MKLINNERGHSVHMGDKRKSSQFILQTFVGINATEAHPIPGLISV